MKSDLNILFEDDYILAVYKKAGIATQTGSVSRMDLYSQVVNYLSGSNPGKAEAHIINRLDQPVKGIVLFAKDSVTAAKLSAQHKSDSLNKYYLATVFGHPTNQEGELKHFVKKLPSSNVSCVCSPDDKEGKLARLLFKVVKSNEFTSLLDIKLITGRHHQIRLQLSDIGCPILGDLKYGTDESIAFSRENRINHVELEAYRLSFLHPHTKKQIILYTEEGNNNECFR